MAMVSLMRVAGSSAKTGERSMDSEERHVAGMRVRIDRLLCVGFETCIEVAPDLFELDEEGIAVFIDDTSTVEREDMMGSCRSCPVDALEVFDATSTQVIP
jgi:ferredoxin